jgi:hypothetical protein
MKKNKKIGFFATAIVSVLGFALNAQAATFTATDVATHNTASDCWVILNNNVYNLTTFISQHSGGQAIIIAQCGKDGTAVFNSGPHSGGTLNVINPLLLGTLAVTQTLTSVSLTPASSVVVVGGMQQLVAGTKDQNGFPVAATLVFSSSNSTVATVDSTGLVAGVSLGTATITVTATNGIITVSGVATVTVEATSPTPILTMVTLTPATSSIMVGGTQQLTASPKDQNSNSIVATSTFSSSNPLIATVNATTGLVTGVSIGTTTITVTSVNGNMTATRTAIVVVTPPVHPVIVRRGDDNNNENENEHKNTSSTENHRISQGGEHHGISQSRNASKSNHGHNRTSNDD